MTLLPSGGVLKPIFSYFSFCSFLTVVKLFGAHELPARLSENFVIASCDKSIEILDLTI